MSKNKKLSKLNKQPLQDNENSMCNLKFSQCDDNKYQLWNLDKMQLKKFVGFAKKIENMKWIEIRNSKSYHYESISNLSKPSFISEDIVLKSIRVDEKFRIYGYRIASDFYIVWFDPNHELT